MKSRLILLLIVYVVLLVNFPLDMASTKHFLDPSLASQYPSLPLLLYAVLVSLAPCLYAVLVLAICGIASVVIVRNGKVY